MSTPLLTIAIPTYNRAEKLRDQIERLLPQLTDEVQLCIYDNASTDHTRNVVADLKQKGVFYSCAQSNCGAERNFFWAFESCTTPWLWILSDDDPVAPSAVATLLDELHRQNCDYIGTTVPEWNFKAYRSGSIVTDLDGLFSKTLFGTLLWLSCGVYKVPSFRPMFRLYNSCISTGAPHVMMVIALLAAQKGTVYLSPAKLIVAAPETPTWSTLDYLVRMSLAPDYLPDPQQQQFLASQLFLEWYYGSLMIGLRETRDPATIRKWKRIRTQAYANMKAYRPRPVWLYALRNILKAGHRKRSLNILKSIFMVNILGLCPNIFFPALKTLLPLPSTSRSKCGE